MLVLSRKKGERIIIDNHIAVVVVEVQGNKVRLGFEAPEDVTIHREEIHRQVVCSGNGMDGPGTLQGA